MSKVNVERRTKDEGSRFRSKSKVQWPMSSDQRRHACCQAPVGNMDGSAWPMTSGRAASKGHAKRAQRNRISGRDAAKRAATASREIVAEHVVFARSASPMKSVRLMSRSRMIRGKIAGARFKASPTVRSVAGIACRSSPAASGPVHRRSPGGISASASRSGRQTPAARKHSSVAICT